jgi:hypothetical protein
MQLLKSMYGKVDTTALKFFKTYVKHLTDRDGCNKHNESGNIILEAVVWVNEIQYLFERKKRLTK